MKTLFILLLIISSSFAISPERTLVLYNSNMPESNFVAKHYQKKRQIPEKNLIGLPMSENGAISIQEFEDSILAPLKAKLTIEGLWQKSLDGKLISTKFDVLTCIYGVPFKTISTKPQPTSDADGNTVPGKKIPLIEVDGASVDSELTLLAAPPISRKGPINNPAFNSVKAATSKTYHGLVLVGRIDGPSPEICIRMINDAIETEKTGLLGTCYLDLAKKGANYEEGNEWLRKIQTANKKLAIPTVMEETKDVYLTNYPMSDAALYFGWYSHHFSGPFRNPEFKLKKGSVITHIHSFSARELRKPNTHWSGPILARGAAATLGNVHEPGLQIIPKLDLFHKLLLDGKTLVESAWLSSPALSWHTLVLGDPLYRPYANAIYDKKTPQGYLHSLAPVNTKTKFSSLVNRAKTTQSSALYEYAGLIQQTLKAHESCLQYFKEAERLAERPKDKLRMILHQIAYHRKQGKKELALALVTVNLSEYQSIPEGKTLLALKNILSPPAPAPVK